jgi:hypothetical protein
MTKETSYLLVIALVLLGACVPAPVVDPPPSTTTRDAIKAGATVVATPTPHPIRTAVAGLADTLSVLLPYTSIIGLLISLLSLIFSTRSLRRTARYERYTFKPRLQLVDEVIQLGSPSGDQVHIASFGSGAGTREAQALIDKPFSFAYKSALANKGEQTVQINQVFIDYGSAEASDKRIKRVIGGRTYLAPGELVHIKLVLSPDDVGDAMSRFGIDECQFQLRVQYSSPEGGAIESVRRLGGYSASTVNLVAQSGDTLD